MRKAGRLAAATFVAAMATALASPADAQVPPVPPVPRIELPQPITDATVTAIDTVLPIVGNAAIQARPAATLIGFGLRAPCAAVGGATFVVALGSSVVVLPVPTGVFLGPAVIFCSGAFQPGPADPVMKQLDAALGPGVEDQGSAALEQIESAVAPVKPSLDQGCGVLKIFAEVPRQLPMPLHRLDYLAVFCD